MPLLVIPIVFVAGGLAYYARELVRARAASAPPLPEPLPPTALTLRCVVGLAHFSSSGRRGNDRVVLTDDLLHLAAWTGIRATYPRSSVTALRSRELLGTVSVDVVHTGEGVVGPAGDAGFWSRSRDVEAFLEQAAARGWPVHRG